ncbi:hypothetical protein ABID81_000269 [Frigoribacterium sp. PvP054]|uniref:Rv3235 family protein n=1 Tax=Frigoribacterium sp. PvP054 TaxID=3156438 RepID=UPI00339B4956
MPSNHQALALAEPAVEPRVPEAPPRPHLRPVPPLVSPRRGSDRDDDAALVTADGPSDDHALDPGRPAAKASTTSPFPDDPALLVENLVRCVVEILAGARDLDQVSRWVTEDVYRTLHTRVVLAARARSAHGTRVQRPAFTTGGVRLSSPVDGVVEAVVVLHGRARSRAVAVRLETYDRRWRATAVHVL